MIQQRDLFRVPYWRFRVSDWKNKKEELLTLLPAVGVDENTGIATDFWESSKVKQYANFVFQTIEKELFEWKEQVGLEKLIISEMWFQHYAYGGSHPYHNHGALGYSAILYIDVPPGGGTSFYSPFGNPYDGNIDSITPTVDEGDVIIFPSFIGHTSNRHIDKDIPKAIISFNIAPNPPPVSFTVVRKS